jgi:hypothetical protein
MTEFILRFSGYLRASALIVGAALALLVHGCIGPAFGQQAPPDDSALYHVVVVTNAPETPGDAALVAAIGGDPSLRRITESCKFFKFPVTDRLFLERYAATLQPSALPMIALIRSDGGILFKAAGGEIPPPDLLARRLVEIATADRIANPRPINAAPTVPKLPPQFAPQLGNAIPWPGFLPGTPTPASVVPGLIPGLLPGLLSPTIKPQIEIPAEVGFVAVAAVVVAVGFCGLLLAGVLILAALMIFRD